MRSLVVYELQGNFLSAFVICRACKQRGRLDSPATILGFLTHALPFEFLSLRDR